jgi:hypothetical protein
VNLAQFQDLRTWHLRHWREQPVEKHLWDGVVMLWLMGWVGGPVALVLQHPEALPASFALLCLPNGYVALRRRLHRRRRVRCDWLTMLR